MINNKLDPRTRPPINNLSQVPNITKQPLPLVAALTLVVLLENAISTFVRNLGGNIITEILDRQQVSKILNKRIFLELGQVRKRHAFLELGKARFGDSTLLNLLSVG